jgi:DNA-binding SARP family transcriptional activator
VGRSIELRILGPLEVSVDGRQIELSGRNERALIAYLAVNANRPVSTDAIIDALWGEAPPPTAREMVRTYVARTRKRLGDVVQRRSGGYVLEVPLSSIDARSFERLVEEGLRQRRDGDYAASASTLHSALALWRGQPVQELQFPGGGEEGARLEELRLAAVESRAQAELSLGHAAELVPELEALVREYPYRERLRADLMLALYRSGRQTDALEQYLDARRLLVEEVGIEPGRELQELQAAILRQDPGLDAPAPSLPPSEPASPIEPGVAWAGRSDRRRLLVAAGGAGLAAAAVLIFLAASLGRQSGAQAFGRRSVGIIDPVAGTVVRTRGLGGDPGPIAVGAHTAWVGDGAKQAVVALSLATLKARSSAQLSDAAYQLATDGTRVWVGIGFDGTLTRIDPSGKTTAPFRPEPHSYGRLALAYGAGRLWVGSQDGALTEIQSPGDRTVAVTRSIGKPNALAVGNGAVWIAEATSDSVLRIGLAPGRKRTWIPIGGLPNDLAVADGSVWAITPEQGLLWRIDERTGAVTASVNVGPGFSLVASPAGQIWVASPAGTAERIDPRKDAVVRTLDLPGPVGGLADGGSRLWISLQ